MIFLTVGTQLPFDRLVRAVDEVAEKEPSLDFFGQVGVDCYVPVHFESAPALTPPEFLARIASARVIIGHAGIGTILAARKYRKPLLAMARRASLKEHRNDHQVATISQMIKLPGVYQVNSSHEIKALLTRSDLTPMSEVYAPGENPLLTAIAARIARSK